jgi:hypothetical protein
VTDSRTVTVSYDNLARQSGWDTGLPLNGGSTSYMNPFLAIIDSTRTPGAVYDPDAVAQHIPQANTAEEFGHEVLGHIWGDMIGGHPAGTRANMRDSIIREDAVRALDPTRGQKGLESHHNYNEMPAGPPPPTCARSEVVISSIDPKGMFVLSSQANAGRDTVLWGTAQRNRLASDLQGENTASSVLAEVAEGTGGEYFHDNNDLSAGFRSLTGFQGSYILAFVPSELKLDGRFHRLKVTLAEKRKGVRRFEAR